MKIHEKINLYSKKMGETAKGLGEEYGMSQQSVSAYLLGDRSMPLEFLTWYLQKHPEIDLYALFNSNERNIVAEERATYEKLKKNKEDIIKKVVALLDAEL